MSTVERLSFLQMPWDPPSAIFSDDGNPPLRVNIVLHSVAMHKLSTCICLVTLTCWMLLDKPNNSWHIHSCQQLAFSWKPTLWFYMVRYQLNLLLWLALSLWEPKPSVWLTWFGLESSLFFKYVSSSKDWGDEVEKWRAVESGTIYWICRYRKACLRINHLTIWDENLSVLVVIGESRQLLHHI